MTSHVDPRVGTLYTSLETDDEFRARVRARGVTSIVVEKTVTRHGWYGVTYDDIERTAYTLDKLEGEALDDAVWAQLKIQRKLVERQSKFAATMTSGDYARAGRP